MYVNKDIIKLSFQCLYKGNRVQKKKKIVLYDILKYLINLKESHRTISPIFLHTYNYN